LEILKNSLYPLQLTIIYPLGTQLYTIGHTIDKIEILVLGGTWSFYPDKYQEEFCRDLFYAANVFNDFTSKKKLRPKLNILQEQHLNESSKCRIIGLTLETRYVQLHSYKHSLTPLTLFRPDYVTMTEVKKLRKYGCTRVQLGVQHTDNDILEYINRECPIEKAVKAIKMLKENCFKVDIHIMPDLPNSDFEKDTKMVRKILQSQVRRPVIPHIFYL
jgi:histone acetyltransferase (RNA polymerase elongator complex component)